MFEESAALPSITNFCKIKQLVDTINWLLQNKDNPICQSVGIVHRGGSYFSIRYRNRNSLLARFSFFDVGMTKA